MASRYWVTGGSGTWTDTDNWSATSGGASGETAPVSTDDVFLDANSGAGTITPTNGGSTKALDCTGFTGTLSVLAHSFFGSFKLVAGMTFSSTSTVTFAGTSSFTITSAGKTFGGTVTINGVGGTYTLQDALEITDATKSVSVSNGIFDANGFNVTTGRVFSSYSNTRSIIMGTGTWTIFGSGTSAWNLSTTTGLTFNAGTSTLKFTDNSATAKTFNGGDQTYATVWNATLGAGTFDVNDSNTFSTLKIDANRAVIFEVSKTTTVLTSTGFDVTGTAGNLITFTSSSAGTAANLSISSGEISTDYLSLKDSAAAGGATYYAGDNSTDVSGNSGWVFTSPPAPVTFIPSVIIIS